MPTVPFTLPDTGDQYGIEGTDEEIRQDQRRNPAVNHVVQQNAGGAEEMVSTAEELSSQAERLRSYRQ